MDLGSLPIEITFRAAALKKKYLAIQPPAAFPVDEHPRSEEEQESADQRIASQHKDSLEASRTQGDAETAWQVFHKAAEVYLGMVVRRRDGGQRTSWRTRTRTTSEGGGTRGGRGAPRTCSQRQ